MANGAVIISGEVGNLMGGIWSQKFEEEENHKKNGKCSKEKIREIEKLDVCMREMGKPMADIEKDDLMWVTLSGKIKEMLCWSGCFSKEKRREIVNKIYQETTFHRSISLFNFAWKCPDKCHLTAR